MAIKRFVLTAGTAEVEALRAKLLADLQRAVTMIAPAVAKGDADARSYQASLVSMKTRVAESNTMTELNAICDEFCELKKSRR